MIPENNADTHAQIFCHIIFASYYNEFVAVQNKELRAWVSSDFSRTSHRAQSTSSWKNVVVDPWGEGTRRNDQHNTSKCLQINDAHVPVWNDAGLVRWYVCVSTGMKYRPHRGHFRVKPWPENWVATPSGYAFGVLVVVGGGSLCVGTGKPLENNIATITIPTFEAGLSVQLGRWWKYARWQG